MIEFSNNADVIIKSNKKLSEGINSILDKFSKVYPSFSDDACKLLEKILVDYFLMFNIKMSVNIQKDVLDNIKIIFTLQDV